MSIENYVQASIFEEDYLYALPTYRSIYEKT